MNIHELDSYDLGDAVKFNKRLNPRLWGADEKMRPEVREQLLKIADDFREFLGIDVEVKDITVSGSNAAYTYTPHSDIDLHLVVDLPQADRNEVYRELFDAKKYAYNDMHNIRIGGADVELYVQDANKPHHSQGIYSLINNDWVSVPKRRRPNVDDISVKSKFEDLGHRIESAVKSGDYERISALADKLKTYRQAGLDAHGEFGPENLAFKILRTQGLIKQLYDARNEAKDRLLSLDERRKKKKKKVRYGYGSYWYPGTAYAGQDHPAGTEGGGGDGGGESVHEDAGMTWDGVNPTTDMFTSEDATMTWDGVNPSTAMFTTETENKSDEEILKDFIKFCVAELKIDHMPRVRLRRDPAWPGRNKTFGRYQDDSKTLEVAWGNRHIMDVLRTVAHELTHKRQHEREDVPASAGETGSEYENEANARAGILMRDWGRLHPEYFDAGQATDLEESWKFSPCTLSSVELSAVLQKSYRTIFEQTGNRWYPHRCSQLAQFVIKSQKNLLKENAQLADLFKFQKSLRGIDRRNSINLQPGKPIAVVQVIPHTADSVIELNGFKIPKKIKNIFTENNGDIKYIEFNDGSTYPDQHFISAGKGGGELEGTNTLFFSTQQEADQAVTMIGYKIPEGWQLSTVNINETQFNESASGYIPTKKQARDPRFSMALTQDIKPGQVGKEANKLKLKTDRQGHPQIARANGLFENLFLEYQQFKKEDYSPDEPPGPESKPTMPAGTLRVDVSDVYDWYKLGQHISNLKGLGRHDFGAGPPSSIISFGDEDTEHKFIDQIKATGLDVTDIDPKDPKKRPGKTVKTDPTYNVDEGIQAPINKNQDAEQYYKFIVGKARLGRPLTRQEQDYVKMYQMYRQQKLAEDEDLDEVKMSPGALEKFAISDAAKGIRAGFEAELIFRDTQGEADELDPEPNYDADERAYSIQQVIDFFSNDEYGNGISQRQMDRLENDLDERYMEWRDEQIMQDFRNDAEDLIRDILLEETPMDQRIHFYLTDSLQMSDEEADAVIKAGAEAPRFTNSTAQKDYADENPEYKAYLEAADEAEQELEESVEFSVNRQDEYWDEALDKYRDDYSGDDEGFFSDVGLRWMSDISNEFGLGWPVWDGGEQQNYGNRNWEDIGSSLQDAVDMPVVVSSNYHSTARRPGQWIIEPDGSLDPDDKSEEAGLEIVSPPMPLLTAIEKLKAVVDWANDPSRGNAYTNSSTGLHMGVSLPTMKSEASGEDTGIDYVKLILFLGDKYVQQQFGREANTYCASALDKLQQNIRGKRSDPAGVVKLLQHGLTELAHKELQKGVGTSKYTSAHIQPGYVEFRSPGGDWLAKSDEEIGILENTMMRFARAMQIAGDPNAERQEYAKKLYKLVTADNPEYADQLKLFSEFSAGTINKEQLKKQWADSVLQKELPSVGKEEYEVYRRDNGNSPDATVGTLYAQDYDDAYDQFLRQYGRDINDLDVRIKQPWFDVFDETGRIVKTLRAKDIDKATERAQYEFGKRWNDSWNIYRRPDDTPEPKASPRAQVAKRIAKPQAPAVGNDEASDWEAVYRPTGRVVDTLSFADSAQAQTWLQSVMRNHQFTNANDVLLRRAGAQEAEPNVAQNFEPRRQNYELVSDEDPDRVVHRMPNATADEVRAWIAQQEQGGMPPGLLRTRIVAEAINPVSGAGALAPRPVITKKSTDRVEPVEPVVQSQKPRSAIGQAISQQDIENMTQQIQMARKLGDDVNENFADGKVKGKSRPGRVKRSGASCAGSVTDLRARAKKYGGEKGKMYHWCANMKSGKKK